MFSSATPLGRISIIVVGLVLVCLVLAAGGARVARDGMLGRIATNYAEQWTQTLAFAVKDPRQQHESYFISDVTERRLNQAISRGLIAHYRVYRADGNVVFSSDQNASAPALSDDDRRILEGVDSFSRSDLVGADDQPSPSMAEAFVVLKANGTPIGYVSVCVDRSSTAPALDRTLFLIYFGFSGLVILLAASALWLVRQYFSRQGQLELDLRKVVDDLTRTEMRANLGHWSSNIGTDKVYWSAGMYAVHGCDPETFIPTKANALSCIVPAERQKYQNEIDQLIKKGGGDKF